MTELQYNPKAQADTEARAKASILEGKAQQLLDMMRWRKILSADAYAKLERVVQGRDMIIDGLFELYRKRPAYSSPPSGRDVWKGYDMDCFVLNTLRPTAGELAAPILKDEP